MPRYDYRCTACSHTFELVQSFKEAGQGICPECQGAGQRLYHAVPVIYKGSGFYTTDYGRPKPPAENGSKSDSDDKSTETGSTDSATKTETKEPAKETASSAASTSDSAATTSAT